MSIMQEFMDDNLKQIKKLAKFDIEKEEQYQRMTVNDFMMHISILSADEE